MGGGFQKIGAGEQNVSLLLAPPLFGIGGVVVSATSPSWNISLLGIDGSVV